MCKNRKDLCVYGSRTACQICKERKVRCSFLDVKRKRKDAEIDSEEDEEPTPKKPRGGCFGTLQDFGVIANTSIYQNVSYTRLQEY
jgi:hypothetical protein